MPLRDVRRVLVELHLIAAGQRTDKGIGARGPGRRDDLSIGRVRAAVADVFQDRALKQPRVLQHHAEGTAQVAARIVAHVAPVDEDRTGVHIVKAHEQLDHRGLAGTGRPDNGNRSAGGHVAAPVVDDRLLGVIAEAHVAERHIAADVLRRGGQRGVGRLFRLVEEGEHALSRGRHGLQLRADLRQLRDRLRKARHIADERLNVADRDRAACGERPAEHDHAHVAELADKRRHRHHEPGQKLALPRRAIEPRIDGIKLLLRRRLAVERTHDIMPGIGLLDLAVDRAEVFLLRDKVALAALDDAARKHARDRQDDERDERHEPADAQHHDQHADEQRDVRDQLRDRLRHTGGHGVHIVRDAREHVADGAALKVAHGHPVDLRADLPAQTVGELLRNAREDPRLEEAARGADKIEREHRQQDLSDLAEVDAAEPRELAPETGGQLRRRRREDLRPDDAERRACQREHEHERQREAIRPEAAQELSQRTLEIFRFFRDAARSASGTRHGQPSSPSSAALSWLSAISR